MAHFSAYSLQDYNAMPACFPRCFVEELAQRPRAARLEEMTRCIERLRLRAPSEQTFGVMAAMLLAVRGDDAPFESGRAYDLFLHVRLPEDPHAFQRDYGATFTDVCDKMRAADITDADFAAEVRSVTARAEMDARPVARRLADALSGETEPDTRSAEPPDVAAAHAGMQVDGSSRSASDNEQGRAAIDVVSQLRDRVLLKRPAGKAASKAAAKPKAAPKSKAAARPRPKVAVKLKAKPRPAAPARKKWQKTPPLALR
ncbi:unnamed protein product [Effrenium voratum]|nr:unnamed protein product [Effrenium voratum]